MVIVENKVEEENINPEDNQVILIPVLGRGRSFYDKIIKTSWIVLILCAVWQIVFFSSAENLYATVVILGDWYLFTIVFLKKETFKKYPLSIITILGLTLNQMYFPLVFTTVENKPVINNLKMPYEVFLHSSLILIVLVISHLIYQYNVRSDKGFIKRALLRADFFSPPTLRQVWMMGIIGLLSMTYINFYLPINNIESKGFLNKLINGLVPFSYAPYFIPFSKLYNKDNVTYKNQVTNIIVFSLILLVISIIRNSRGSFMFGYVAIVLSYFIALALDLYKPVLFTLKNMLIIFFSLWIISGPLADLGSAMVIVRGQRHDVKGFDFLNLTIDTFNDKEAIKYTNRKVIETNFDWDETYLDNIFFTRFCNIKYSDNTLYDVQRIGFYDERIQDYSEKYILSILPDPFLKFLQIDLDKDEIVSGSSIGDVIHYRADHSSLVLGGKKSSHIAGTGLATFGWWYLLFLGIGIIPIYFLFDAFTRKRYVMNHDKTVSIIPQFSLCGLIVLLQIFFFISMESVVEIVSFLMRGWIQIVVLYYLVFKLSKLLTMFSKKIVFK